MELWEALGWLAASTALTLGACEPPQHALPPRAAFDLSCPEDSLAIVEIDAHTRGVRGCGQQAVYTQTCSSGGGTVATAHCSWMLEPGSRTSVGQAPSLPPPSPLPPPTSPEAAAPLPPPAQTVPAPPAPAEAAAAVSPTPAAQPPPPVQSAPSTASPAAPPSRVAPPATGTPTESFPPSE